MSASERITAEEVQHQHGHTQRYELAASLLQPGDRVLDAACGIGYGAEILHTHGPRHTYEGIDRDGVDARYLKYGWFTHTDLNTWQPTDTTWDVAISFETLEHLADPQHLADVISHARRVLCISVPTQPTKHFNPYHLHDFTVDDIPAMFPDWCLDQLIEQPEELSHIFIFRRASA